MPLDAAVGEKYYAAFKAEVEASEPNGLADGTYWVSIEGTVTAPIRHYATWSDLSTGRVTPLPAITKRDAVMWSFTNVGTDQTKVDDANAITGAGTSSKMDTGATSAEWQGFNKQWWLSKADTDIADGWQESATNVFAANVAAGAEACFDFSEFTGLTLETPAVKTGGTAYTATTGSQPAIAAQVTTAQLANADSRRRPGASPPPRPASATSLSRPATGTCPSRSAPLLASVRSPPLLSSPLTLVTAGPAPSTVSTVTLPGSGLTLLPVLPPRSTPTS